MKTKKGIAFLKGVAAALLLFIALFPIYWLLAMGIRETEEMRGHISVIPRSLTFEHFTQLFTREGFGTAILNSMQTTLGSLAISLLVGICCAYILARRRFRFGFKRTMTYWVLLVRVLPPVAFTIPLYIMFNRIGILNTKLPVLLACVLINVPLTIWFLISFFQDLPEEIEESAKVDGASEWQIFTKICLPECRAALYSIAILVFIDYWHMVEQPLILLKDADAQPLSVFLSNINSGEIGLAFAMASVYMIPSLLLFLHGEEYLVEGIATQGSVKG